MKKNYYVKPEIELVEMESVQMVCDSFTGNTQVSATMGDGETGLDFGGSTSNAKEPEGGWIPD